MSRPLRVFLVAGERSGDALGAGLMTALAAGGSVAFSGVGGPLMRGQGLESLFPLDDIAVMGFAPVLARLPSLLARIRETARAAIEAEPDVLVIVDSPDFTHRVARKVRAARPGIAVVNYVSPSVWAWRPGRARAMAGYIDRVLALLPFEPDVHARLGGPACDYVGHPLIERLATLRPAPGERAPVGAEGARRLLVLPGSRAGVIRRHMPLFGQALAALGGAGLAVDLPTVPHLREEVASLSADWPVRPRILTGEEDKLAAFRAGQAALAASGTVTLELALSGIPTVAAYRLEWLAALAFRHVGIKAPFVLLPNLILGERAVPEFIGDDATPARLSGALAALLADTAERRAQEHALARLDARMRLDNGERPSERAARLVRRTVAETNEGAAGMAAPS